MCLSLVIRHWLLGIIEEQGSGGAMSVLHVLIDIIQINYYISSVGGARGVLCLNK